MAAFSDLTPVLLDATKAHRPDDGNWALWPVHGYRVVAPRPIDDSLNLFQRAILGLCHADVRQAVRQAQCLGIEPDLALVVLGELRQLRLIEASGAVTKDGLARLRGLDDDRLAEPCVGWIFADALSGLWWSRFVPAPLATLRPLPLSEAPQRPASERRVRLPFGTEGAPVLREALRWEPHNAPPGPLLPTPQQILELVQRRRRRRTSGDDAPVVRQVALVDEHPAPFYLAVRASTEGLGYSVADPFTGEPDHELTAWMERLRAGEPASREGERRKGPNGQPLWAWLTGGQQKERHERLCELQQRAEDEVEQRLTVAIAEHPREKERLVAMQRTLLEAQQPGSPRDKWSDVMVKAQLVLEHLIGHFVPDKKAPERRRHLIGMVPRETRAARSLFEALALRAGFAAPPKTLVSIQPGKVVAALQSGKGSLRPLTLAALLAAHDQPDHPLRQVARSDPQFLQELDRVAGLRDEAAHAGQADPAAMQRCQNSIEQAVSFAFGATTALLLPHLVSSR